MLTVQPFVKNVQKCFEITVYI